MTRPLGGDATDREFEILEAFLRETSASAERAAVALALEASPARAMQLIAFAHLKLAAAHGVVLGEMTRSPLASDRFALAARITAEETIEDFEGAVPFGP